MIKTEIFPINNEYRIVYQTYEYEGLAEYTIWADFFKVDDWRLWESIFYNRKTPSFVSTSFKNKKTVKCIFKQKKLKNF